MSSPTAAPRKRQAILHIGTPKTGTTSIQKSLMEWTAGLAAQGFRYAQSPGKRNHVGLVGYALGDGRDNNIMRRAGGAGSTIRARLERTLAAELAALPEAIHTVIFSSEQLSVRLDGPASVARLHGLLAPLFDPIRVVIYLRRQDETAVSKYSTSLRAGGETRFALLPSAGGMGGTHDHSAIIDRYAAAFGAAAITPRLFERPTLVAGDVVRDFLQVCGIDPAGLDFGPRHSNSALRADVQELVRRFNALVEERKVADRPRLGRHLRDPRFHGKARLPPRSEALAFYQRYAASNERIRAAYFPERTTLFTEDFDRYPEAEDATAYADDKVLEVALDVLLTVSGELRAAQVEVEYVRAQQAEAAGRFIEARRHYAAVLQGERDHRQARHGLQRVQEAEAAGTAGTGQPVRRRKSAEAAGASADQAAAGDAAAESPAAPAGRRRKRDEAARPSAKDARKTRRQNRQGAVSEAASPDAVSAEAMQGAASRSDRRAARRADRAAASG